MAKRPGVPKFGTWDSENVRYTAYFDKVRENKGATAPPLHRPYKPNDPEDNRRMSAPPSRPATSSGHREPQRRAPNGQHRRTGSNSSAASDPGGRGADQSKFAPPPQYHPRPGPHHGHHRQPPAGHGVGGHRVPQAPRHQVAPRARSASPQNNAPNRQRPSAVPKFGVWNEQNAATAQGFTVQFENVKRHREVARAAVPDVPRVPSPERAAAARRSWDTTFLSKMFGCFLPTARD